jgi:hypothetical protein
MATSSPKTRVITLTDRAPVRIVEADWPIVASARRHDGAVECQANHQWHLTVRQHADGRALVYGSERAGDGGVFAGYEPAMAGELLAAGDDVAAAVRRVGEESRCSDGMVSECIADLPAEDLS